MGVSINGYIAKVDGDSEWTSEEDLAGFYTQSKKAGNIIMGANTFKSAYDYGYFPFPDAVNVVVTHKENENKWGDKVIFIASWVSLTPLSLRTPREREIVKPWYDSPIDFVKAKTHANSFTAVFSDNDPYVTFGENSKIYREKMGAKIILQKGMGHFSEDTGVTKLPVLLKLI